MLIKMLITEIYIFNFNFKWIWCPSLIKVFVFYTSPRTSQPFSAVRGKIESLPLGYLLATPSGLAERQYPFGGQMSRLCRLTAWVLTHFSPFPKRQFPQRIQLFFSSDSHRKLAALNLLTTFALSAHQSRLCTIQ